MAIRVNGGILTDQMLAGSLLYFKIAGDLEYAISDGTVTIEGTAMRGGDPLVTTYFLVDTDQPVPNSLAEHVIEKLSERCTIVQISFVGDPGAETEMHLAISGSGFGWIDASGDVDTTAMVAAIGDPVSITVPTTNGTLPANDEDVRKSGAPATIATSTTVTVTESPFILA